MCVLWGKGGGGGVAWGGALMWFREKRTVP